MHVRMCIYVCSEVHVDKHIVCEPCSGRVLGGFDPDSKQVTMATSYATPIN